MDEKLKKKKNRSRAAIYATLTTLGVLAAGGAGFAVAYAAYYDADLKNPHKIEIDQTQVHDYNVSVDPQNAKKGDTVVFKVKSQANIVYEPSAIRITSVPKRAGEKGVSSDYPLLPDGYGGYYAKVTILYTTNMKAEIIFDELEDWTVTFDTNGGTGEYPKQKVERGKLIKPVADPKRNGYTFKYWYVEGRGPDEGENVPFDFETRIIQGNTTLKAKWEANIHTVYWRNYDNTLLEEDKVAYGDTPTYDRDIPTKPSIPEFEYIFNGWDKKILPMPDEDVTYTATFANKIRSYAVDFHTQYGSVPSTSINYGQKIPKPDVSYEGYTLSNWYTEPAFTNVWDFGVNTVNGKVDLYAKWDINQYTIEYDLAGGTGSFTPSKQDYGTTLDKPADPTKENFKFLGWAVEGKEWIFNNDIKGRTPTKLTKNIILVAQWEGACTVTFDAQNATPVDTYFVERGKTLAVAPTPTREGYTFDGWYTDPVGGNKVTFPATINSNITYYAHWTVETYTVTFHKAATQEVVKVNYGEKVQRPQNPTPAKGKKFVTWVTEDEGTVEFDFSQPIKANTEVWAKFTDCEIASIAVKTFPKLEYTVGDTLSLAGLTVEATLEDGSVVELTSTQYEVNTDAFDNTKPGVYPITIKTKGSSLIKTTTFYVYVKQQIITVTFDSNYSGGGTYDVKIEKGSTVARPLDPARAEYTFAGWYEEAACTTAFDFTQPVTANKTLYAKWEFAGQLIITEPDDETDRKAYSNHEATTWTWTAGDTVKYTYTFPGIFSLDSSANGIIPSTDLKASAKMTYEDHEYVMDGKIEDGDKSGTFYVSLTKTFTYAESPTSSEDMYRLKSGAELTISDFVIQTNDGSKTYECQNEYKCYTRPKLVVPTAGKTWDLDHATQGASEENWNKMMLIPLINGSDANVTTSQFFRATTPQWVYYDGEPRISIFDGDNKSYLNIYAKFIATSVIKGETLEFGFEVEFNNDSTTHYKKEVGSSPTLNMHIPNS